MLNITSAIKKATRVNIIRTMKFTFSFFNLFFVSVFKLNFLHPTKCILSNSPSVKESSLQKKWRYKRTFTKSGRCF